MRLVRAKAVESDEGPALLDAGAEITVAGTVQCAWPAAAEVVEVS